jgi:hypothetical protein
MTLTTPEGHSMAYSPHRPTGTRCACNAITSTEPHNKWYFVPECRAEVGQFKSGVLDADISQAERVDIDALLMVLLLRAQQGVVQINKEYKVMESVQHILELRPDPEPRYSLLRPRRHLRLYFGEPDQPANMLLGLHMSTKPYGSESNEQVNASVAIAANRADIWAEGD